MIVYVQKPEKIKKDYLYKISIQFRKIFGHGP